MVTILFSTMDTLIHFHADFVDTVQELLLHECTLPESRVDLCDRAFMWYDQGDTGVIDADELVRLMYQLGVVDDSVPEDEVKSTMADCGVADGKMFRYQFFLWVAQAFEEYSEEEFRGLMQALIRDKHDKLQN